MITPQLSPDGQGLGWLTHDADLSAVAIRPFPAAANARPPTVIRGRPGERFTYFAWAGTAAVVCSVDRGGGERRRLAMYDTRDGAFRQWIDFASRDSAADVRLVRATGGEALATSERDGETVLFRQRFDGPAEIVATLPAKSLKCVVDRATRSAVVDHVVGGGRQWTMLDLTGRFDEPTSTLLRLGREDERTTSPLVLDSGGLYARWSVGRDAATLARIDTVTGSVNICAEHAGRDLTRSFLLAGRPFLSSFGKGRADLLRPHTVAARQLVAALTEDRGAIDVHSVREDLAICTGPTAIRGLWAVRAGEPGRVQRLAELPDVEASDDCVTVTATVTAADGVKLDAFVTSASHGPGASRPCILLVHGGPWARDDATPPRDALELAAAGFSVVRVNFRGSTGRGKTFINAADGQWSGTVLDDLESALTQLRCRRLIGAGSVAVVGHSFGGYASLMLAARGWPACVVAESCPVDLAALVACYRARQPMHADELQRRIWPDPATVALSPVDVVDRVRCPVLISFGERDARIPVADGVRYARSLADRGIEVSLIVHDREGHRLQSPDARQQYADRRLSFLRRHLVSGTVSG